MALPPGPIPWPGLQLIWKPADDGKKWELPFVLGVVGDFAGHPATPAVPLRERRFTTLNSITFPVLMSQISPRLVFHVKDVFSPAGGEFAIELRFDSMADFLPDGVIRQVAPLRKQLQKRQNLLGFYHRMMRDEKLEMLAEQWWTSAVSENGAAVAVDAEMKRAFEAAYEAAGEPLDGISECFEHLAAVSGDSGLRKCKSFYKVIKQVVADCDARLSMQLALVMQHSEFQRLEAAWRGLWPLLNYRVEVLHLTKDELRSAVLLELAGSGGGPLQRLGLHNCGAEDAPPLDALIGDYYFDREPADIELLQGIARLASAAFCPFISGVSPRMLGMAAFSQLADSGGFVDVVDDVTRAKWDLLRQSPAARYIALTLPRVLARAPYQRTVELGEFQFSEIPAQPVDNASPIFGQPGCWINPAYVMAFRLTRAYFGTGWWKCIYFHGGVHTDSSLYENHLTEIGIDHGLEDQLSSLGLIPLLAMSEPYQCRFNRTYTLHKPLEAGRDRNGKNRPDGARETPLGVVMMISRIAHYIQAIARQIGIGAATDTVELERHLSVWLADYSCQHSRPSEADKAKFPWTGAAMRIEPTLSSPARGKVTVSLDVWVEPPIERWRAEFQVDVEVSASAQTPESAGFVPARDIPPKYPVVPGGYGREGRKGYSSPRGRF